MIGKLKKFLQRQDSLERTLFWVFLVIVLTASVASTVFTIYEQISPVTSAVCLLTSVICAVLAVVAVKTRMYSVCYVVMCLLLSCFLLPMLFFLCGGFNCGMTLYCLTAVFLCAYCPGKSKWVVFVLSMLAFEIAFVLSELYPEYVVALDHQAAFIDILVSFFITGVVVFIINSFALYSYNTERKGREEMLKRLEFLSKRDSKTGLFNRGYMTHFLESVVWLQREGYYLLLLDMDEFREVNASYGQVFGDQVLCDVAKFLIQERDDRIGECCGRMDGELFMCVLRADSELEAFARAERIREGIAALRWNRFPDASVTVSGCFIACGDRNYSHFSQFLVKAEEVLYLAKTEGRNKIRKIDCHPRAPICHPRAGGDLLVVKRFSVSASVDKVLINWLKRVVLAFFA